jgi:hypothetical protein
MMNQKPIELLQHVSNVILECLACVMTALGEDEM